MIKRGNMTHTQHMKMYRERNAAIYFMRQTNTLVDVGRAYDLSRERVRSICDKIDRMHKHAMYILGEPYDHIGRKDYAESYYRRREEETKQNE